METAAGGQSLIAKMFREQGHAFCHLCSLVTEATLVSVWFLSCSYLDFTETWATGCHFVVAPPSPGAS